MIEALKKYHKMVMDLSRTDGSRSYYFFLDVVFAFGVVCGFCWVGFRAFIEKYFRV